MKVSQQELKERPQGIKDQNFILRSAALIKGTSGISVEGAPQRAQASAHIGATTLAGYGQAGRRLSQPGPNRAPLASVLP